MCAHTRPALSSGPASGREARARPAGLPSESRRPRSHRHSPGRVPVRPSAGVSTTVISVFENRKHFQFSAGGAEHFKTSCDGCFTHRNVQPGSGYNPVTLATPQRCHCHHRRLPGKCPHAHLQRTRPGCQLCCRLSLRVHPRESRPVVGAVPWAVSRVWLASLRGRVAGGPRTCVGGST